MKNLVIKLYATIMIMPLGLRLLTLFSVGGSLFFFAIVPLPRGSFHVNGNELSYTEWILAGFGPAISTMGALFLASSVGFVKRKGWSRPCFLLAPTVALVLRDTTSTIISGLGSLFLFWFLPFGLYLFRRRTVKTYFVEK